VIPSRLEDWTIAAIERIAATGPVENDVYDFKIKVPDADTCRAITAAFSNTRGGFLIFGVDKHRNVLGTDNPETPRNFQNALAKDFEPSPDYEFAPPLPLANGNQVFVAHIRQSKRGPHAVREKEKWVYLERTAGGTNVSMSPSQTRMAFQDAEATQGKLNILIGELREIREVAKLLEEALAGRPEHLSVTAAAFLNRYPTDVLQLLLADPSIFGLLGVDEGLWKELGKIRETVRRSNMFGDLLARSLTEIVGKANLLQTDVRDTAVAIIERCDRVLPILESQISKVRPAENGE
jgi:hypothetical protein